MLESEYKDRFNLIGNHISGATRSFYTSVEINKFASEGTENHQKLQRDWHFWSSEMYSLQSTYFITLGRLFDKRPDVYSLGNFVTDTLLSKDLFTKDALAARKRASSGEKEPAWLAEYLTDIWQPTDADFNKIEATADAAFAVWNPKYKIIRHKVFAHTDAKIDPAELFDKTLVGELEDIIHSLNKFRIVIFQLLENGREYWIEDDNRSYADPFIQDVRQLLGHLRFHG